MKRLILLLGMLILPANLGCQCDMLGIPVPGVYEREMQRLQQQNQEINRIQKVIYATGVDDSTALSWAASFVKRSVQANVDVDWLVSMAWAESEFTETAYNPDDPSWGMMMVMPRYWRYVFVDECGVEASPDNLMTADIAICYGAHIWAERLVFFGDTTMAITAYNNWDGEPSPYFNRVHGARQQLFE